MGEQGVEGSNAAAEQRQGSAPDPASFREECLSAAEAAAQQLLSCIHPTLDSEEDRRDIIDYVVRLIKTGLNCEVFPYGSVPLKTYLPDGDIDLTAVNDDSMAHDVFALLKMEEKNLVAEFKVKDTQFIDAEVKIVKCLVRNTIIDISFNQLGGLSALCFLEQIDRLVGRNHLFKRSIILIKAWCYYESRILGAHHGLISTYALEILVLYIFQLYHSSLFGPLVVLYRFLEYYSKFDWDNYCISLKGPVCKSSLPDIAVEVPENGWADMIFSENFLENCVEMFSVSSRVLEGRPRAFQPKNLNIIDPLKENNNLGRSVHIGNFYRIRSSFKYGARKLGQVLSLPCDKIAYEIPKFFSNAVARHGHATRNSIQHLALKFGEESLTTSMPLPITFISEDSMLPKLPVNDDDGVELLSMNQTGLPLQTGYSSSHMSHGYYSAPVSWNQPFYFSLSPENGSLESMKFLKSDQQWLVDDRYERGMDTLLAIYPTNLGSSVTKANNVGDRSLDSKKLNTTSTGDSEALNPMADLSGDYDSHIRSLLYSQSCNGFFLPAVAHLPPHWWVPLTTQSVSSERSNRRAAHSAPPANVFSSEAQKNGSLGETHTRGRSRKTASDGVNQLSGHGESNESFTASAVKSKDSDSHKMLLEKGGPQREGRLNAKHSSPSSFAKHTDGNLSGTWRIKFGSIGSLAEEILSASANMGEPERQGETAVMKQERFVAGQVIHLKSEAEFPPLGL